jgi:hypothetical protein
MRKVKELRGVPTYQRGSLLAAEGGIRMDLEHRNRDKTVFEGLGWVSPSIRWGNISVPRRQ